MMTPANLVQLLEQDISAPPDRKYSPATEAIVHQFLESIQGPVRALDKQYVAIVNNPRWTDQGKREQLAKLGKDFTTQFKEIKQELSDRSKTIERNRRTLFHVESPVEDGLLRYLRASEIRADFRDADAGERVAMFLDAAERNQAEVLAAVLDAPGSALIPEEYTSSALQQRAERLYGGEHGLLSTYQQQMLTHEFVSTWRNWIGLTLEGLGVPREHVDTTLGVAVTAPAPQPAAAGL
jgi:hypothetical protein